VTLVPAKKNIMRRAKGRLHGCTACATAVRAAATIPAGVSDLCDQARYTIARVTGTAIMAFILRRSWKSGEDMEGGRAVDMQASFLNAYSIRGTQVNVLPRGSSDTSLTTNRDQ
jgi:hypothetical protein